MDSMGDVNKKLDKIIKSFEAANGSKVKDFTQKEIIIMMNGELKEDMKTLLKRLDRHISWAEKNNNEVKKEFAECQERHTKVFHEHDIIMKELIEAMPEKGWCEKVNNALFPTLPEMPLAYRVSTMWHDRRWTKTILVALLGIGGVSIVNLILQVI